MVRPFTLAALLLAWMPFSLAAQFTQSSIVGSVTDASGSPVANAAITVRNEGTILPGQFAPSKGATIVYPDWKPGFIR
jgi:hypothetical protein